MPAAVVDTNILVRALLKPDSSDGAVFRLFLNSQLELFYSQTQLAELEGVLTYSRIEKKYHLLPDDVATFLGTIISYGVLVEPSHRVSLCRDPDDNELLSVAVSMEKGEPTYLITADKDLLVLAGTVRGITILTPQAYLHLRT